jgi:hypothetical protein
MISNICLAESQFFDELTRSSPHFGLKRIKPVVEKIAGHIDTPDLRAAKRLWMN